MRKRLIKLFFNFLLLFLFIDVIYSSCPLTTTGDGSVGNPCQITNWDELQAINTDVSTLGYSYILINDLNSSTVGYSKYQSGGSSGTFTPIGDNINPFTGSFDGNNKIIHDLYIDLNQINKGLFGYVNNSATIIKDLGIENVTIDGNVLNNNHNVGGLIGYIESALLIDNCFTTGYVLGTERVGGLIGFNGGSDVENSHSDTYVRSYRHSGGLVGRDESGKTYQNCYATGDLNGRLRTGGLIGGAYNSETEIFNCFAMGNVYSSSHHAGGFVGENTAGKILDSYALGDVNGDIGGGFVSRGYETIYNNSYSIGLVQRSTQLIGFVGGWNAICNNVFYDTITSGRGDVWCGSVEL